MKPAKRFRVYASLLCLYPSRYRKQYKEQMLQTVSDMIDDASSKNEKIAIWLRISCDLPLTICKEHFHVIGEYMDVYKEQNSTRIAVVSSALLFLPIILLVVNHMLKLSGPGRGLPMFYLIPLTSIPFFLASALSAHALYALAQKNKRLLLRRWPLILLFITSFTLFILIILDTIRMYDLLTK